MKNRKTETLNILQKFFVFATFVLIILNAIILANKDTVVISKGISFYNSLYDFTIGLLVLAFLGSIGIFTMNVFAKFNLKKQKRMEEEKKLVEKTEENLKKKKEEESLSIKRDLDSNKLRNMLMTYINGSWSEYSKELFKAVSQLNKMDEQQKKLERLIQNNGAESLSDTQDVLEKTEQYICKNVRKIINYIDVADPNDKAARNKVEEKLVRCCENNEIVLEKTNDFLFAMADYLNSQGDDDESVQTMEIYKETILNAID